MPYLTEATAIRRLWTRNPTLLLGSEIICKNFFFKILKIIINKLEEWCYNKLAYYL